MAIQNPIPTAYDPRNIEFLIGLIEPYDFAPDTKIVINKTEDLVIPQAGVNGTVAFSINTNTLGTATLSLKNTSKFNQNLMLWAANLTQFDIGLVPFFSFQLKDPSSQLGIETYGWIQSQPDWTIGSEIGQLDWVIGLADARYKMFQGQSAVEPITAYSAGALV